MPAARTTFKAYRAYMPHRTYTSRVVVLLCGILFLAACDTSPTSFTLRGDALGTFYTISIAELPADMSEAKAKGLADSVLDRVNRLMSTYLEDSELSRFNRYEEAAPFQLSVETYTVFEAAQAIAEQSGGAFDVTVGPLVNAWGFGPEALQNPPDDAAIAALLERVGYQKLMLHPEKKISKARPDLYCDLSAIAKGYAVDAVAEAFEETGIRNYMVEVGGEIRVSGKNAHGLDWTLGIESPKPGVRDLHTAVRIGQGALATSGDYRNMYELEGRLVSHTMDPHTGYPVPHALASVSVIHTSCMWADGYATALMALGPEKAMVFARKHGLAAMLLVHDADAGHFKEISTPAFDACRVEHPGQ